MELGLREKVVLVTGSSRGIGKAIALAFAEEGARVVVTGRHPDDVEITTSELGKVCEKEYIHSFVGDLQREDHILACAESVLRNWGRIDGLIANIGSGRGQTGWEAKDEEWVRLFDINLFSGVRVARAVIPHLIHSGKGSIVFVSSIAGVEHVGAPAPYDAAKAGVIAFSKHLSRTLAVHGVRVNTVLPGNIHFAGSPWDDKLKNDRENILAKIEAEVPLKRFGSPEEVADAVVFLTSTRASFITGACLVVDGGQTRAFRVGL